MAANPWDRMPSESSRAFAAFVLYRDAGAKRSLSATADALRGQRSSNGRAVPGRITEWSAAHDWVSRAAAYDAHVDRQVQAEAVDRAKQRRLRHEQVAAAIANRASQAALQAPLDLPFDRAARIALEAMRAERELLDEIAPPPAAATATAENHVTVNIHGYDVDKDVLDEFMARKAQHEAWVAEQAAKHAGPVNAGYPKREDTHGRS